MQNLSWQHIISLGKDKGCPNEQVVATVGEPFAVNA